jgi:hypothetical protein
MEKPHPFFIRKTEAPETTIFRADLQDPHKSLPTFTEPRRVGHQ